MPSRKKLAWFLLIFLILSLSGFSYVYANQYLPLQEKINALQQSIKDEERLITALEQNEGKDNGEIINQTTGLQERLPVAPLLDQVILELEKAEVASGSKITSFSFNENQPVNEEAETEETVNDLEQEEQNQEGQNTETENEAETASLETPLPEGIERLTVTLTVEAPGYRELEAFIKAVEEMPRISKIDTLSFTGNREIRDLSINTNEKLTYSLAISTFYYPKLVELRNQLPTYEVPPPAERTNPLFPAGSTGSDKGREKNLGNGQTNNGENEDSSKNDTDGTPSSSKTDKENGDDTSPKTNTDKDGEDASSKTPQSNVEKYTVQPGDTLYSIALEKYNIKDGHKILQDWNGITPEELQAGMTIEIPILEK